MRVKVLKGEDQVGIVEAPEDGRETGAFREAFKLGDVGRGWVVTVEDRERAWRARRWCQTALRCPSPEGGGKAARGRR